VRIAYDQWAEGARERQREPLLLIMGLGVSRLWWPDGFCRALAGQGFAVARYDQRDAGESTRLPSTAPRSPVAALFGRREGSYSAEEMTDDAVAVMEALGWESAHVLGHSLGGAVAQRMAVRHPGRVRTLTSMAAVPGDAAGLRTLPYVRLGTLARFARLRFPPTREGDIEAALAVARLVASPGYPFDEEAVRVAVARTADSGIRDGGAQSRQIGAQWRGPAISTITAPSLVLHGQGDPLIRPRAGRAVADRIPGARLVTYPGLGHDLPEQIWSAVAAEVRLLRLRAAGAARGGPSTSRT